jgi:hypothetical protein
MFKQQYQKKPLHMLGREDFSLKKLEGRRQKAKGREGRRQKAD